MLKPAERGALAYWWRDCGRYVFAGGMSVLGPFCVIYGLYLGFTVN